MKKYYFFVGLLICILTGCGNSNTAEGGTDQNSVDFPENYNKTIENVIFNTDIVINRNSEKQTLYETTATIQKKDNDKAYEVLFEDVDSEKAADIDRADGKEIYYQGTKGESLFITPYTLFMSKTLYPYIVNAFSLEGEDYNADLYLTGKEFTFSDIKQAYQNIVETASLFGLDISGQYTCYSLDYNQMKENEYAFGNDGKINVDSYKACWEEKDNGYYFAIHQMLQGYVVQYPLADVYCKITDANAPIQVLYTENGIEMLDICEIFTFSQSDQKLNLVSFDEIAMTVADKYSMILSDAEYEVTRAELFFRPIKNEKDTYEVVPAWEISIVDKKTNTYSWMYINAATNEEIV